MGGGMKTEVVKLSQVAVNDRNPRTITDTKFDKLINSILALPKMLDLRPIVVDDTMVALGGNMRYRALTAISQMDSTELADRLNGIKDFQKKTEAEQQALLAYWDKWSKAPTAIIARGTELTEDEQREFIIKDNVGFGDWDMDALANEWDTEELSDWGLELWDDMANGGGGDSDSDSSGQNSEPKNASLTDRFVIPPFSVLDTRNGYWQARKKLWRDKIGDLGESRNDKLITSLEIKFKDLYQKTRQHREELGISFREYLDKYVSEEEKAREASKVLSQGVSLFDPVLSEICCRWFTPREGAKIFDPFAGDTQKGLVFGMCGYEFTGIELRQEQVEINNRVIEGRELPVRYINDDGQNVASHIEADSQDLLFSCPPYFDLEKYSDLPNDASNQKTYGEFIDILRNAYTSALGCLKDNRFVVIVVGDVRDRSTGFYYDFCGDIKRIFKDNGVNLYNEIILVETGASTALRAARYMESRKVAKMHQNILVFFKGNPSKLKSEFPKIELNDSDKEVFNALANEFAAEGETEEEETPVSETSNYENPNNKIMLELQEFRKQFIKQGFIGYEHYPKILESIESGDIHIVRSPETGEIDGYLWMQDLKKKPLSRIYEICSNRKGLGRELIELALRVKKNEKLQLYVLDTNENAISFYQYMGFVEIERETGKNINNITMEYRG